MTAFDSVGFTGTKMGMRDIQATSLTHVLISLSMEHLPHAHVRFHHGDCVGADVQAAHIAKTLGWYIVCHPPINPRHRGWFKYNDSIHIPYEYIVRDRHIVDVSQVLIATPHTPYEIVRSGTWTTVRYARKRVGRSISSGQME